MSLIDSHCHIDMLDYQSLHKDFDDVIKKSMLKQVNFILAVSTSLKSFKKLLNKVINNKNIFCSCGIHPLNKEKYSLNKLIKLADIYKVIALGECGLDYFHNINEKDVLYQKKLFTCHIRAGINIKKPIIIHSRNAYLDLLNILVEEKIEYCGGVIHCFTGNTNIVKKFLDLGLYISFSGIVTFKKNTEEIIKSLKFVPLNRLLIETDSPFLTPVPFRGKENQPAFIRETAKFIARIKQVSVEHLSYVTTKNFCNLFNVKLN